MARKRVSAENEIEVLLCSRRRCAICFGLDNDFQTKKGQIAHLDRDNSNSEPDNLVFLCLEHHDDYDSIRHQSKGLKQREVKLFRQRLYDFVKNWHSTRTVIENETSPDIKGSNNKFSVFKLANQDSICGYPYLALADSRKKYFSIAADHFSIESFEYWEVSQWLNCDYSKTKIDFTFEYNEFEDFIKKYLFETKFVFTGFINRANTIEQSSFAFNEGKKYYELEYKLKMNQLIKSSRPSGFKRTIELKNIDDEDVQIYNAIKNRFANFLEFRQKLLSSSI